MGSSLLDNVVPHEHVWFANPTTRIPRDVLDGMTEIAAEAERMALAAFREDIGICQYRLCRVCGLLEYRWTNLDGEWRPILRLALRLMEGGADGD